MSLKRTLFIGETVLKDNSVLQNNIDAKLLKPSIQWAQDAVVQNLLGTRLYRELQRQIYEADIEEDYKDLLDNYIEPLMIYAVLGEVPDQLLIKMMNLTVGTTTEEQISSSSIRATSYLKEQYKNKMKFYAKRLNDYLHWNTDKFPEYLQHLEDEIPASGRAYTSQIAMPRHSSGKVPAQVKYNDIVYDFISKSWQ